MKKWNGVRWIALVLAFALLAGVLAGCGKSGSENKVVDKPKADSDKAAGALVLNGAGASFPYPIYSKWFSEYNKLNNNVRINYQSIGSGGGQKQITEKTVDFGGSDAPMKDEQLAKTPGLMHIPTVLGSVVITYNLPEVKGVMKLTPDVVAGIFLGEITKWNDPKLTNLNPDLKLPGTAIAVVTRSDGSGTTAVFTDYLSKVSATWKTKVGSNTSVKFPVGIGAKGNEGVSGQVKQTPGAVGYVELAYAEQNKLPYALLQNKAGKFVKASIESTTAAAAGASASMPDDLRVSITNPDGDKAYPIASFTYVLAYKDQADQKKGEALAKFLWWAVHDGEKMASDLLYAPLPAEVVKKVEAKIKSMNYQGKGFIQ